LPIQLENVSAKEAFAAGCQFDASGNAQAALRAFGLAAEKQPGNTVYWQALAAVSLRLGLLQGALDASRRALAIAPTDPDLMFGLAFVLQMAGKQDESLAAYRNLLAQQPDYRNALLNMPLLLADSGRLEEAITLLHQGLALRPDDADLHFNQGNLLLAQGEYEAAAMAYRRALAIDAGMVRARIAAALMDAAQGDIAQAMAEFDDIAVKQPAALAAFISPLREDRGQPVVRRGLAGFSVLAGHERLKKADWRKRDVLIRNFQEFIEADTTRFALDAPEYLFLSYALEMPSPCRARLAGKIATRLASEAGRKSDLTKPCSSSPERIRLGYLAADFRRHPLFDVFQPILKLHDRQAFEIILFSTGPDDGSAERKRLIELADCFVDLQHLDDKARAGRIAAESPDILVDLSGYTLHAAPQLLAQRLAPLQFSYAGFLCSQGAPWIDYTILDRQLLQEAERPWWAEQIIHAPVFPLVRPARAVELAAAEISPANERPAELPAGQGFVFCAFHNTWKVNPRSFAMWMQILQRSGHSVLWLLADDQSVRRNYLEAASEHGVDPARLCFAAPMPHREHLLRLRHADLFLDTVGCGAHTTAGEALVLGVPLLTHAGVAVHERYAAALLLDAGLPELVVDDEQAYVQAAVELATNPAAHRACREHVAQAFSLTAVELHDSNCVRALETAFSAALAEYRCGKKPADRDLPG